jgi:predicted TIM-barrel fold metal-dependent hydrolase
MIVNCHAHFFNFYVLNTSRTRETLVNRLRRDNWPDYLVKVVTRVFDELLKDEHLDEERILRKLLKALRTSEQFKKLINDAFGAIPGDVGILLHGDLDAVSVGLLRRAINKLSDRLSQNDDLGSGDLEDIVGFLITGLQPTMEDVGNLYFEQTPPEAAAVALMMDITREAKGDSQRFREQIWHTSGLALDFPGRVLPFFAVNPARKDCLELLKRAAEEQGFVGVKLYPSLGYDPLGPEMRRVYEYCERAQLPLMMHCNQGGFFFAKTDIAFADPALWKDYLADHPELRICFGHFGGDDALAAAPKPQKIGGWARTILDLMKVSPGVFADVSYHVEAMNGGDREERYFKNLQWILDDPDLGGRVLWGSDFPLVRLRAREENYWHFFQFKLGTDRFRQIAERNPAAYLGLPKSSGKGAAPNILRHLAFLAANKYSVKRLPEEWVDRALRNSMQREVDFTVNPFGREWTTHNIAHVYCLKAILVSRFPKEQWNQTFLQFGNMFVRDMPNWPLEVESDRNRADTFSKFAIELDGTLRKSRGSGGPGARYEVGINRETAIQALEDTFKNGAARLFAFGSVVDDHYRFPEEVQLG